MEWTLRAARADEWREARRLRLEMLADTPIAYARSLAETEALTDEEWRERARRVELDDNHSVVVVDADGRWVGQAIGLDHGPEDQPPFESPGVASVYLSPAYRGQGALRAMIDEIAVWLRGRGHRRMTLLVHEDNARAIRAYEKLGFEFDGNACPYRLDPTRRDLQMVRLL